MINDATFQYGGGAINTPNFTIPSQSVLAFITGRDVLPAAARLATPTLGTHVYITNNNFFDNFDAAMQIEPNGLLAGDPLDPAGIGPSVLPRQRHAGQRHRRPGRRHRPALLPRSTRAPTTTTSAPSRRSRRTSGYVNQTVNAVWDPTDLTYVLRGTIVLGRGRLLRRRRRTCPTPDTPVPDTLRTDPEPVVTLTIQAALPGTLLADGTTIPSPGQSVIVKLLNDETPHDAGWRPDTASARPGVGGRRTPGPASSSASTTASIRPPSPLIDPGRLLRAPHPRHPGQPDDRPAASAGHHHLAPRRHGRHDRPRRADGRHLQQLTRPQAIVGQSHDGQSLTTPERRRRRLHLHRRPLADRVRPDRSRSTAASSTTPTSAT